MQLNKDEAVTSLKLLDKAMMQSRSPDWVCFLYQLKSKKAEKKYLKWTRSPWRNLEQEQAESAHGKGSLLKDPLQSRGELGSF